MLLFFRLPMWPQPDAHGSDTPVRPGTQSSAVSENSPTLATSDGTCTKDPASPVTWSAAAHASLLSPD